MEPLTRPEIRAAWEAKEITGERAMRLLTKPKWKATHYATFWTWAEIYAAWRAKEIAGERAMRLAPWAFWKAKEITGERAMELLFGTKVEPPKKKSGVPNRNR